MDLTLLSVFVLTFTSILILPGPNTAFVVGQSLKYGVFNALFVPLGFMAATAVHAIMVFSGLGVIIKEFTYLLAMLKWMGVFYLLFLAYKSFISKASKYDISFQPVSRLKIFKSALFVSLTNPKALLASIMIYPLFISQGQPFFPQATILTICAMAISLTVYGMYGVVASAFKDNVVNSAAANKIAAVLYAGAAAVLAVKEA